MASRLNLHSSNTNMALIQLCALGASDVWLIARRDDLDAIPCNLPSYNHFSFIHGEMDTTYDGNIYHQNGVQLPFSVKKGEVCYENPTCMEKCNIKSII